MTNVWRTCLICGKADAALRVHQKSDFELTTDAGDDLIIDAERPGLNVWYCCLRDAEEGRAGCGAIYAAPYRLTGDAIEAEAAFVAAVAFVGGDEASR